MFVKKLSNFFARVSIVSRCNRRVGVYVYVRVWGGQGQGAGAPGQRTKNPPGGVGMCAHRGAVRQPG